MSVQRISRGNGATGWKVRWREGSRQPSRVFDRKRDADAFDTEVRRRRRLGTLAHLDAGAETLDSYASGTWAPSHAQHLAPKTRTLYAYLYDLHIAPRLGHVPLRELNAETVSRWQADLLASGVGPVAARKAVTLLGGILQRAAEGERIASNPVRVVRRVPLPARPEVRPLAPDAVEALRARLTPRDAVLVSLLAYAGLRPGEARTLRWGHVHDRTLTVNAAKTKTRRSVRLLALLAQDLREWRLAAGRPGPDTPVIPAHNGREWTDNGYRLWATRTFAPALEAAGLPHARVYDLRHSFASLLLHEGRSVIYVARQLGHGAQLTMGTYGHVIEELEGTPRLSAEDAIRAARGLSRTGTADP